MPSHLMERVFDHLPLDIREVVLTHFQLSPKNPLGPSWPPQQPTPTTRHRRSDMGTHIQLYPSRAHIKARRAPHHRLPVRLYHTRLVTTLLLEMFPHLHIHLLQLNRRRPGGHVEGFEEEGREFAEALGVVASICDSLDMGHLLDEIPQFPVVAEAEGIFEDEVARVLDHFFKGLTEDGVGILVAREEGVGHDEGAVGNFFGDGLETSADLADVIQRIRVPIIAVRVLLLNISQYIPQKLCGKLVHGILLLRLELSPNVPLRPSSLGFSDTHYFLSHGIVIRHNEGNA
ncbi:hypothetical protein QBC47DRAFT_374409 [Echria macrotheca]|uniref:Uncharacterized protein n=1 Tax=Echria macrotheca TaxID=438768 RepID=A0AAJ0BJL8_9PEZI|nr:hypothetical protein QBC47DRAFT_374409 [Echria macrotheca]